MGTASSLVHSERGLAVSWPASVMRVSLLLPLTLLAGMRPMVSNLTHVDKDILSVLLVAGFTTFSLWAFLLRLKSRRSDFIAVDILIFLQFTIALTASLIYILSGTSQSSDALYGIYCYSLSPLLLYTGFVFVRTRREWKWALYWACLLTYVIMLVAGACQVFGIDFWLFQNDRFQTQRNFLGIGRASGLYGTQIDFGCLSFICVAFAYYAFRNQKKVHLIFMFLGIAGVVLSISRVWFLAATIVVVTPILRTKSVKQLFGVAVLMCVLGAVLVPAMNALGLIDSILSRDEVSQQSNDDRLYYFKKSPQWLLDEYVIAGMGPGTQTGPDPLGKVHRRLHVAWNTHRLWNSGGCRDSRAAHSRVDAGRVACLSPKDAECFAQFGHHSMWRAVPRVVCEQHIRTHGDFIHLLHDLWCFTICK